MIPKLRVPLGFVAAAVVLWVATPSGRSILVGLPVAAAGLMFRMLAAGVIRKDRTLATGGLYSLTRNPLYFGSTLLAAGFGIMSGNGLAVLVLIVPSAMVYPVVIRNEEAHLERQFGDQFRQYCRTTPRFLPAFRPFAWDFSFSQYWANREYRACLGFVTAFGIMLSKWMLRP